MQIKPIAAPYKADPQITSLGAKIGDPVAAAQFPEAVLRWRNDRWAATVGLSDLPDSDWIGHFARFAPLPDNLPQPLALRYHGHQFRVYNPQIGDGRGFLFAQMRDHLGRLVDLGTKGSGTTPYSREADGRLTLKGAVRELLATEMLEALGVDTSKTFSIVETGEELWRGDEPSPTRSAVLVRLSHSHIRIGSFQRIAFERGEDMMRALTEYCLRQFYNAEPQENPAAQLLELAALRIADLAASYMVAGFVHGVLNTDNINITGESFDYGPWRFTPHWDPNFTAAYFDEHGLYAFGRQTETMHWNLGQLAVALRLISDAPPLIAALEKFPSLYQAAIVKRFLWRLGIKSQSEPSDRQLVEAAECAMGSAKIEIDTFFHRHRGGSNARQKSSNEQYSSFLTLLEHYQGEAATGAQKKPKKPCSMHIDEVEQIWDAIAQGDDWQPLMTKIAQIRDFGKLLTGN
ncbi:MAG: YdiU family protein [Sphingorhabdus sp.]